MMSNEGKRGFGMKIGPNWVVDPDPADWAECPVEVSVTAGPAKGSTVVYGQPTKGWPGQGAHPDPASFPQASLTAFTVCTRCGQRIKQGDVVTAVLRVPPAQGSWHHQDCADPGLVEAGDE